MRVIDVPVKDIYVPSAKKKTLEEDKILPLAEDILENGLQKPIYVRQGKGRWVLQEGLHRLEAIKLLGGETIESHQVAARKH
jgi:ParB-like chromosome segregation protein Spo0J